MTTSPRQYTTSPESTPLNASFVSNPLADPPRKNEGWAGRQRNWIPDPRDPSRSRTLILCFDGTGDQFDNDNSNIVQLMALLKKDSQEQRVYYQTGVGTYKGPSSRAPGVVSKVLDLMLANTLGAHVRDGYEFLMENYCLGDKICLFGFSRGAYTARALAGMLSKVGLLPAGNKQQIPFAYHMYSRQDAHALSLCKDFKRTYGIDVKIEFCGVWDTVASVGIIPKSLPFVATNNGIRFFRHALALDEHRSKFMPNFYKQWEEEDLTAAASDNDCDDEGHEDHEEKPSSSIMRLMDPPKRNPHPVKREHSQAWLLEYDLNSQSEQKTDSLEVFFAGSHADVGGGSVENNVKHSLARIPLRWMIRECFKAQTGIIFDMDMLQKEIGIDIDVVNRKLLQPPDRIPAHKHDYRLRKASKRPSDTESYNGKPQTQSVTFPRLRTLFKSRHALPLSHTPDASSSSPKRSLNEAEEELQDALSPIYDQLQLAPFWWILEICPLKQLKQQAIYNVTDNSDDFFWMVNRGKGRKVFKHVVQRGIKVHRSVLTRLEALDEHNRSKTYIPLIRPNIHAEQDGKDVHMHFRYMKHEEWVNRRAPGVDNSWFEWVE